MIHAFVLAAALAAPVTVPFTMESNHLVIDVAIDGKPTRALFDTGGGNALDTDFAKAIGLRTVARGTIGGAGEGTVDAARAQVRTLAFGDLGLHDQEFAVFRLPGTLTRGEARPIEAIVGREILRRYATRIDYAARTLTFTPAARFAYGGTGVALPIRFYAGTPIVEGSIDGLPGLFEIDTGSSASLILTSPFVAANDLRGRYATTGSTIVGRGVGGYTRADLAQGKLLTLGTVRLPDPLLDLSTDSRGAFASPRVAGNVGNDVLSRLTLTFDYERRTLYVEPNPAGRLPLPPNRAGMYVENDERRFFTIIDVLPNGPAYDAGLRAGERIVAVDGKPAQALTASDFWKLMRGIPGTMLALTVDRDGIPTAVTVTLRDPFVGGLRSGSRAPRATSASARS